MKKNFVIITIFILLIFYLFTNQYLISNSIIKTSYLFINKVLPTLLPMFIISKILINYNFAYYISKIFKNNIYIYILVISFLTGCPNNVILINDLLEKKIITLNEANKYIKCSFFNNPLFLYSMLSAVFNNKIAILIIIIQVLSNIIIYLIHPIKNNNIVKIKTIDFNTVLIESIQKVSILLLNIYITILIFNIIIVLIPNKLNCLIGIFEITQGLNYLSNSNIYFINKIMLSIIYISFGGLCIHIQIKSVLKDTQINYYNFFISRFYAIIISMILMLPHMVYLVIHSYY